MRIFAVHKSLDGFFFDVDKWFADLMATRMSFAEKGVYLVMLFQQWREAGHSLPDTPLAIADLIAITDSQTAEIERAWPVVRRKFVTLDGDPLRIVNLKVEKTRRQQAANARTRSKAGRVAGLASAAKRLPPQKIPLNESLTDVERPSTDKKEEIRLDQIRLERENTPARPRLHAAPTVFSGSLPRDHAAHVFCDPTFSVCVPPAVHAKFIGPLSRSCGGDRQQAQDRLMAWYAEVARELPADAVMGDAFKFWQPRFDAAFATQAVVLQKTAQAREADTRADADRLRSLLREDRRA